MNIKQFKHIESANYAKEKVEKAQFESYITAELDMNKGEVFLFCNEFSVTVPANRINGLHQTLDKLVNHLREVGELVDSYGIKLR